MQSIHNATRKTKVKIKESDYNFHSVLVPPNTKINQLRDKNVIWVLINTFFSLHTQDTYSDLHSLFHTVLTNPRTVKLCQKLFLVTYQSPQSL